MSQTHAISRDVKTTIDAWPDDPDAFHAPGPGLAVHLLCGQEVVVRLARPRDTDMIQTYIAGLSPASRRNRFLGSLNEVSSDDLYRMTHTDGCNYAALIAENVVEGGSIVIGEARYAVASDGLHCEFAISVDETWQRKTLGTLLVGIVAYQARALGLRYLVGDVFRSNEAMIALARRTGFAVTGPVVDARLIRVTKDLSLLDALQPWNELASESRLIAADELN
jgi:RimJ/RimL family protein N-acetyltransferase